MSAPAPRPGFRCLGIDFGEKRLGLSFGDDLGIATPLPALRRDSGSAWLESLETLCARRRITDLVVGYPINMDDSLGFKAREVDAFIRELETRLGLHVHRVDERLTSYAARGGAGKPRDPKERASGVIDSRAACLILQDFLDTRLGDSAPQPGAPGS
ncbi:MAG: Holliday junction resolvase RuvX [Puniceicoccaceae bacterium]|nr:MAG: Holliday junction resolvase RuvX [Puniceicoccaceae bacterium]